MDATTRDQGYEHAYAGFLTEASLLIRNGLTADLSRGPFLKLIHSLWELKHSYRVLGKDTVASKIEALSTMVNPLPGSTNSETITVFLSKSTALLTTAFATEQIEGNCIDLAKILFRIKEGFKKHRKPLSKLTIVIGGKEERAKDPILERVLDGFATQEPFQEVRNNDGLIRVKPTILPGVYLAQKKSHNGSASNYRQLFYLVGSDALPENYQTTFIQSA
jgi:hypothetical protein